VLLVVGNIWAYCAQASAEEVAWLTEFLQLPPRQFRKEKLITFSAGDIRFYAGLVALIRRQAAHYNFKVVIRETIARTLHYDKSKVRWLFDYQEEALQAIEEKRRGILEIPTGGGKGEVCVAAVVGFGGQWLGLSPSRDLMYQLEGRYHLRTGMRGGIVGDGVWRPDPLGRFTSCTYDTLAENIGTARVQKLLASAQGIFADEAHTAPSNTCGKVLVGVESGGKRIGGCPNAEIRIGASGTPFDRSDKRDVMTVAYIGERVYTIDRQTLEDKGVLAKAEIDFLQVYQTMDIEELEDATSDNPYPETYRRLVVTSALRNGMIARAAMIRPGPRLVFVESVDHGHELKKAFKACGAVVDFVFGDNDKEERTDVLQGLCHRTLDVAIATRMWRTGIDVPQLMTVVNAAARKSVIELRQGIGRGIRRMDSNRRVMKDVFYVLDVYDRGCRYLQEAAESRMSTLRRVGYNIRLV
jgi:superfamily II DNA or RNA helicase